MPTELSAREIAAINRLGDLLLPGFKDLPAFSKSDCVQHIDDVLDNAPSDDVAHLRSLLKLLYYAPDVFLRFLVRHMQENRRPSEFWGGQFRKLSFGLRGLIFSCYYNEKNRNISHKKSPLAVIGAEINRVSS